MHQLERTILRQLFADKNYTERVVPYLKEEYFHTQEAAVVYRLFQAFYDKFRTIPAFAAIRIGLDSVTSLTEKTAQDAQGALKEIETEGPLPADQTDWILEETEEFCQERAVYVALQKSIGVMDDPKATRHVIPDLLKDALAVSFDNHIGHDYFADADARWDFYHAAEARIPFDLVTLNNMTGGGTPRKTLNVILAGTNVGKSLFLCHMAAACIRDNKNVLYITMEMAEERIAERIDANLFDIPLDDLESLPRSDYIDRIIRLRRLTQGRLLIKEYPTGAAHAGHFRALMHEAKLKQNFTPHIVIVDYLTICSSSRVKAGNAINSYTLYKFVAEELRGLAVEFGVPLWTAAQFNRTGHASSDPSMTDIGESWAIAQTVDFMFAAVQTEELEKLGQLSLIPLKNRYRKKNSFQRETLAVNTDRMKLYDVVGVSPSFNASAAGGGMTPSPVRSRTRRPLKQLEKEASGDI